VARALLPHAEPAAAPIIKWVGGKTKLLPELTARMPPRHGRYFEPFAGGPRCSSASPRRAPCSPTRTRT
jgi:hypothetical protein